MQTTRISGRSALRIIACITLAAVTAFAGVACRKKGAIAKTDSTPAQPQLLGLEHGLVGYPGANPDKTKAYLQSLHWATDSIVNGPVSCSTGDDCGGASSVNLKILPEANAHLDDISSAFAPGTIGGFIMAIVINVDSSHKFGPLDLAPHDTAYLWAGSTKSSGQLFGFYKINGATGQAHGVARAAYGAYCPPTGTRTIPAVHVPMYQCQTQPIYGSASTASTERITSQALYRLASNPIFAATMLHTQGLWISCSLGCCQVGSVAPAPLE